MILQDSRQRVVAFDIPQPEVDVGDPDELSPIEEKKGSLSVQFEEDKLMHLVLENDEETIKDGKLLSSAINNNFGGFTPDLAFEKLVKEYSLASHIYGDKLIRLLTGYRADYIKKNIKIPEFQKLLKEKIDERFLNMRKSGLLTKQGDMTDKAMELSSLVLYLEELDHLLSRGLIGNKPNKNKSHYGEKTDVRDYHKGDKYRDIEVRKSIRSAMRRMHSHVEKDDLRIAERRSKGSVEIVYALDASGSMKGLKIEMAKRAGVALAYTAISEKDKVGLLVFGTEVLEQIRPTHDFMHLLRKISSVSAADQTNIPETIRKSLELFSENKITKHLILLTDALPTTGEDPEKEALDAVEHAGAAGITVSVIGINLDKRGKAFAEKLVRLGKGRFYVAHNTKDLDVIVLRDYYSV